MDIFAFIKGELLEIIEFNDDSRDTLSWRFPDEDKAIKNGAQLIVREAKSPNSFISVSSAIVSHPANTRWLPRTFRF